MLRYTTLIISALLLFSTAASAQPSFRITIGNDRNQGYMSQNRCYNNGNQVYYDNGYYDDGYYDDYRYDNRRRKRNRRYRKNRRRANRINNRRYNNRRYGRINQQCPPPGHYRCATHGTFCSH